VIAAPVTQLDPFAPEYLHDPYPVVAALREDAPVAYAPEIDMWVVSRYADVDAVFRDPATFSAAIAQAPLVPLSDDARAILAEGFRPAQVMSNLDPPEHGRIRKHTSRAFSARRMALLEPTIRARTTALVDAFAARGEAELVRELTFPLPAATIFTMIGFPDRDTELLKSYCDERLIITWGRPSVDDQCRVARQMVDYWRYCEAFVAERVRDPADDFTSDLLATAREDGTLSEREIASIIYGLSFAGHETTTNLIANTVRRVLEQRGAWDAIVAGAGAIPNAVEEALRFDSSVIAWRRITTRATTIGGVALPERAKILLLLCAANRDPARFPEPDRFDVTRTGARSHLAFGIGIHYCLGAALARLQVAIVLETLAARFPTLRLVPAQELSFSPNISFRGPRELRVAWDQLPEKSST
jgi:cytochrome P450